MILIKGCRLDDDYTYDPNLDFDPYPPPPPDYDLFPKPDDYTPDDLEQLSDIPSPAQDGLQGFETREPQNESWSWHDARLVGVDRGEEAGGKRYEVGAIDLYADADTGDLGRQLSTHRHL